MIASEDRNIPKTKLTHRYNVYSKSWVKKDKAPSGAPTYDQHQGVSQSRMPRSIIQAPNEGKTVFRIPGGEFKDEDFRTSEQVVNPQFLSQEVLTALEHQANPDRHEEGIAMPMAAPTTAVSYNPLREERTAIGYRNPALDVDPRQPERGQQSVDNDFKPSEFIDHLTGQPSAKIPASPGQSGSSGVYRTQTGPITLDDMERILSSVYAEKQACGCSHPCQQPCSCVTSAQKGRVSKSGADRAVTKEEYERAQRFSRDLKESRRQFETEHEGEWVPKEFGRQSLFIPEMAESIQRDCDCPKDIQTGNTIKCMCMVRKEQK